MDKILIQVSIWRALSLLSWVNTSPWQERGKTVLCQSPIWQGVALLIHKGCIVFYAVDKQQDVSRLVTSEIMNKSANPFLHWIYSFFQKWFSIFQTVPNHIGKSTNNHLYVACVAWCDKHHHELIWESVELEDVSYNGSNDVISSHAQVLPFQHFFNGPYLFASGSARGKLRKLPRVICSHVYDNNFNTLSDPVSEMCVSEHGHVAVDMKPSGVAYLLPTKEDSWGKGKGDSPIILGTGDRSSNIANLVMLHPVNPTTQ